MENKWEIRERKTKRIALIISVLLHLVVLIAVTSNTGKNVKNSIQNMFEEGFGGRQSQDEAQADIKV
ncbi:MAG TPA: hypothetical protein VI603_18785 [Saprospiraceae bacterium]|nr:hypothetical protein [Saprospiraceae bacterium]